MQASGAAAAAGSATSRAAAPEAQASHRGSGAQPPALARPLQGGRPPAGARRLGPASTVTGKPRRRYLRLGARPVPPQHCRPLRHDHSARVWAAGVGTRMWGPAACAGGGARRRSALRLRGGAAASGTAAARAGHDGRRVAQAAQAVGGAHVGTAGEAPLGQNRKVRAEAGAGSRSQGLWRG